MGESLLDRLARAVSGSRRTPMLEPRAAIAERRYSRRETVKAAVGFALAASLGRGLRPDAARAADSCEEQCRAVDGVNAATGILGCANSYLAFPGVGTLSLLGCAMGGVFGWRISEDLCPKKSFTRDAAGNCKFGGPNPPRFPTPRVPAFPKETLNTSSPTQKKPSKAKKPPKNKKPSKALPKGPSAPGGPCAYLCPGCACCPEPRIEAGWIPCSRGCSNTGRGCCGISDCL